MSALRELAKCRTSLGNSPARWVGLVPDSTPAKDAQALINEAGLRIPEDISLVGFDDIPWAQFADPPLTTVHLQAQELARRACLVLMDLLHGQTPEPKRQVIETHLVVRKSCRRI